MESQQTSLGALFWARNLGWRRWQFPRPAPPLQIKPPAKTSQWMFSGVRTITTSKGSASGYSTWPAGGSPKKDYAN